MNFQERFGIITVSLRRWWVDPIRAGKNQREAACGRLHAIAEKEERNLMNLGFVVLMGIGTVFFGLICIIL